MNEMRQESRETPVHAEMTEAQFRQVRSVGNGADVSPKPKKLSPAQRLKLRGEAKQRARIQHQTEEALEKSLAAVEASYKLRAKEAPELWAATKKTLDAVFLAIKMVHESVLAFVHENFRPLLNLMDIEQDVFDAQINAITADLATTSRSARQVHELHTEHHEEKTMGSAEVALVSAQQIDALMNLLYKTVMPIQSELFEKASQAFQKHVSQEGYDPETVENRTIISAYAMLQVSVMTAEQKQAMIDQYQEAADPALDKDVVTDVEFKEEKAAEAV